MLKPSKKEPEHDEPSDDPRHASHCSWARHREDWISRLEHHPAFELPACLLWSPPSGVRRHCVCA